MTRSSTPMPRHKSTGKHWVKVPSDSPFLMQLNPADGWLDYHPDGKSEPLTVMLARDKDRWDVYAVVEVMLSHMHVGVMVADH